MYILVKYIYNNLWRMKLKYKDRNDLGSGKPKNKNI
jgi:hypothetical protein